MRESPVAPRTRPGSAVAPLVVVARSAGLLAGSTVAVSAKAAVGAMVAGALIGVGATAAASPSDSTALRLDVVGRPGGGLHLAPALAGGVSVPGGAGSEVSLPRAVVHDDRGGGARDWSASVAVVGGAAWEVSYRVTALRPPATGTAMARMPEWTVVRAAREAVVATGLAGPAETGAWEPRVRIAPARGNAGSIGAGSSGSSGAGSSGPGAPVRAALVTSVM